MFKGMSKKRVNWALAIASAVLLSGCGKGGTDGPGGIGAGIAGSVACPTGGYAYNAPIAFAGTVFKNSAQISSSGGSLQLGAQPGVANPLTYSTLINGNLTGYGSMQLQSTSGYTGSSTLAQGVLTLGATSLAYINTLMATTNSGYQGYPPNQQYPNQQYPNQQYSNPRYACVTGIQFNASIVDNGGAFYNGTPSLKTLYQTQVILLMNINGAQGQVNLGAF